MAIIHIPDAEEIIAAMRRKNYRIYDNPTGNHINLVGIRNSSSEPGHFDDLLCVLYLSDGIWNSFAFPASTDPGAFFRDSPLNVNGTVVMKPGQYRDAFKIGRPEGYKALQQAGQITVFQDSNLDAEFDLSAAGEDQQSHSLSIQPASRGPASTQLDKWNSGNQVVQDPGQYAFLMSLCEKSADGYGNAFTYTLLEDIDFTAELDASVIIVESEASDLSPPVSSSPVIPLPPAESRAPEPDWDTDSDTNPSTRTSATSDDAAASSRPEPDIDFDATLGFYVAGGGASDEDTAMPDDEASATMLPGSTLSEEATATDDDARTTVALGASRPDSVSPGDEFTVSFAAYLPALELEVESQLSNLSAHANSVLDIKRCQWLKGAEFEVELRANGLDIDEPRQQFTWNGQKELIFWDVCLPQNSPGNTRVLKIDVFTGKIRIAKLRLDLTISAQGTQGRNSVTGVEPAKTGFASYASKDRVRVLDMVQAIETNAGIDVFMDCMDIRPGEEWRNVILKEIAERDQFLLFWSSNAKNSEWVDLEWRTAYPLIPSVDFQIHPLDSPSVAPPPDELKHYHFDSLHAQLRRGYPN